MTRLELKCPQCGSVDVFKVFLDSEPQQATCVECGDVEYLPAFFPANQKADE